PLLWKKIKKGLSAGCVQSVAMKMIVDSEIEINDLKSEKYWSITGQWEKNNEKFDGTFQSVNRKKTPLPQKENVQKILDELTYKEFNVDKVVKRERKRNPAPPFITSSLQQEAARKLNFRARKTMMVAQQLYEGIDL